MESCCMSKTTRPEVPARSSSAPGWFAVGFAAGAFVRLLDRPPNPVPPRPGDPAPVPQPPKDPENAGRRPARSVILQVLIGITFVYGSFLFYRQVVNPLQPPAVSGTMQAYVSDASIPMRLDVKFSSAKGAAGPSPVRIAIVLLGPKRVQSVGWALVFYGDACIAERGACLRTVASARTTQPAARARGRPR